MACSLSCCCRRSTIALDAIQDRSFKNSRFSKHLHLKKRREIDLSQRTRYSEEKRSIYRESRDLMRPQEHVKLSAIAAAAAWPWLKQDVWIPFTASILIDADHY